MIYFKNIPNIFKFLTKPLKESIACIHLRRFHIKTPPHFRKLSGSSVSLKKTNHLAGSKKHARANESGGVTEKTSFFYRSDPDHVSECAFSRFPCATQAGFHFDIGFVPLRSRKRLCVHAPGPRTTTQHRTPSHAVLSSPSKRTGGRLHGCCCCRATGSVHEAARANRSGAHVGHPRGGGAVSVSR